MHPIGFKIPLHNDASIRIEKWDEAFSYETVHYHEEYQLTYIMDGDGTLLVGSDSYEFVPGEVFLFGKNLPHAFRDKKNCIRDKKERGLRKISIFFKKDCYAPLLEHHLEVVTIKNLLANNFCGIKLHDTARLKILDSMSRFSNIKDFERVLELLQLLNCISKEKKNIVKESVHYKDLDFIDKGLEKLDSIFEFILANYTKKITLAEIAMRFNMTASAFCRFFKSRTKKTFSAYLIEIRIKKACELIRSGNYNVTESCYGCGFTNISNFHRHFKKIVRMTPTQYKESFNMSDT